MRFSSAAGPLESCFRDLLGLVDFAAISSGILLPRWVWEAQSRTASTEMSSRGTGPVATKKYPSSHCDFSCETGRVGHRDLPPRLHASGSSQPVPPAWSGSRSEYWQLAGGSGSSRRKPGSPSDHVCEAGDHPSWRLRVMRHLLHPARAKPRATHGDLRGRRPDLADRLYARHSCRADRGPLAGQLSRRHRLPVLLPATRRRFGRWSRQRCSHKQRSLAWSPSSSHSVVTPTQRPGHHPS